MLALSFSGNGNEMSPGERHDSSGRFVPANEQILHHSEIFLPKIGTGSEALTARKPARRVDLLPRSDGEVR